MVESQTTGADEWQAFVANWIAVAPIETSATSRMIDSMVQVVEHSDQRTVQ